MWIENLTIDLGRIFSPPLLGFKIYFNYLLFQCFPPPPPPPAFLFSLVLDFLSLCSAFPSSLPSLFRPYGHSNQPLAAVVCLVTADVSQLVRLQNNFSLTPVNCELAFLPASHGASLGMLLIPAHGLLMQRYFAWPLYVSSTGGCWWALVRGL